MITKKDIENLDRTTVLLSLNHLAHEFLEAIPKDQRLPVETADDARRVVARLAEQLETASAGVNAEQIVPDDADIDAIGRETLAMFLEDPGVRDDVEDLLAEPPEDAQMAGLELITGSAIVLGALVAWVQIMFQLSVVYRDGKLQEFTLKIHKDKTDPKTISRIVKYLTKLIKT